MKRFYIVFLFLFIITLSGCNLIKDFALWEDLQTIVESPDTEEDSKKEAIQELALSLSDGYFTFFNGPNETFLVQVNPASNTALDFDDDSFQPFEIFLINKQDLSLIGKTSFLPLSSDREIYTELENRIYSDGTFAIKTICTQSTVFTFYNDLFEEVETFTFPFKGDVFVSQDKQYFYFSDSTLVKLPIGNSQKEKITLPVGLNIYSVDGIDPLDDTLFLTLFRGDDYDNTFLGVYDPSCSRFLYLNDTAYDHYGTASQGYFHIYQGDYSGVFLFSDQALYPLPFDSSVTYKTTADGRFLFSQDITHSPQTSSCFVFCPNTPKAIYLLSDYPGIQAISDAIYIEKQDLFIISLITEDSGCSSLFSLDLSLLPIDTIEQSSAKNISLLVASEFLQPDDGNTIPQYLSECQEKAESMEKNYGINILLSSESSFRAQQGGFVSNSTAQTNPDNESEVILKALNVLEDFLNRFPSGFFQQFSLGSDNGFCFMPVGSIESTYSVIAYERYDIYFHQYELVFDCNYSEDRTATLTHEMWHAIEDYIGQFPDDKWDQLNPNDFTYTEQYEKYDESVSDDYILYKTTANETYFIDKYSKTYAKEDRARIFEYFFARSRMKDALLESPHLVEKYRFLLDTIRCNFDSSSWSEVPLWEEIIQSGRRR